MRYIESAENYYYCKKDQPYKVHPLGHSSMPPRVIKQSNNNNNNSDDLAMNDRIFFNKEYLQWFNGIPRLILVIALTGGWISAAAASRSSNLGIFPDFSSTRTAYLVFVVIAFVINLIIFIICVTNFVNFKKMARLPWTHIFVGIDIVFFICVLSVSIASAVRESQLSMVSPIVYASYNRGAFGAAAAFGFIACAIQFLFITIWVYEILKERRDLGKTRSTRSAVLSSKENKTAPIQPPLGNQPASNVIDNSNYFQQQKPSVIYVERDTSEDI